MSSITSTESFARLSRASINGTRLNRPHDWQMFERLVRDLFVRMTGDVHMDLNGRSGQPQAGVDVFGTDQRSRENIGIQCRGRDGGAALSESRVSGDALRIEVDKARKFVPKLDVFVLVTTGPNDANLKRAAAKLNAEQKRRGGFRIEVHGWDWIEGKLKEHVDLSAQYGLIAVIEEVAPRSKVALQIGTRLTAAIELMNRNRGTDDRFTLQNISEHLGHGDWRRLEGIAEGRTDADSAELSGVAHELGICERWLIEGKSYPFAVDACDYRGADEQYEAIMRLMPKRIIFARERDDPFDSLVVAQVNEYRWITYQWDHPASGSVGGTGRRQLFEYCCLMRRLFRSFDFPGGGACYGRHLDTGDFRALQAGELHPRSLLHTFSNDHWWTDFAELADGRVSGISPRDCALREAIEIARDVLAEFQKGAQQSDWMRDILDLAGFPLCERRPAERYAIDTGLYDTDA